MAELYRNLTTEEISIMQQNGCYSQSWDKIMVQDGFNARFFRDATFIGECFLGRQRSAEFGIYRSTIDTCEVEDDVRISDVTGKISNCRICCDAVISGVGNISFSAGCSGGAGVRVSTINEAGGREVTIYPGLSAQCAYLQAFTKHLPPVSQALDHIATKVTEKSKLARCIIGSSARIERVSLIKDSHIGEGAVIEGAHEIISSTVNGSIKMGSAVRNSVIDDGAEIGVNTLLEHCFVAGGAMIGEGFSAENSLFFANCECMRGEACSIFAGPFTVSHHQSTLLLTGVFSFYNAGSGTNFSNHRYKLGPVHQGVMERGAKSGSSSYLLWPGQIGMFSSVIGKHTSTLNTSELPFSVIIEQGGKSVILPGATVFSAGLERDIIKWHKRDRRPSSSPDLLNTAGFNPLTGNMIQRGSEVLSIMTDKNKDYPHAGGIIPGGYLAKAKARYHTAINFYYGEILVRGIEVGFLNENIDKHALFNDYWHDWAGLLLPDYAAQDIFDELARGDIDSVEKLQSRLIEIADLYKEYEWLWLMDKLEIDENTVRSKIKLQAAVKNWLDAVHVRQEILLRDAGKEFTPAMHTSYGLIGDQIADFHSVRGKMDDNKFINMVRNETKDAQERAARALKIIDESL